LEKAKRKETNYFRKIRNKKVHSKNGPATKWAMPIRATTKRAAPKWLRYKVVYLVLYSKI